MSDDNQDPRDRLREAAEEFKYALFEVMGSTDPTIKAFGNGFAEGIAESLMFMVRTQDAPEPFAPLPYFYLDLVKRFLLKPMGGLTPDDRASLLDDIPQEVFEALWQARLDRTLAANHPNNPPDPNLGADQALFRILKRPK